MVPLVDALSFYSLSSTQELLLQDGGSNKGVRGWRRRRGREQSLQGASQSRPRAHPSAYFPLLSLTGGQKWPIFRIFVCFGHLAL